MLLRAPASLLRPLRPSLRLQSPPLRIPLRPLLIPQTRTFSILRYLADIPLSILTPQFRELLNTAMPIVTAFPRYIFMMVLLVFVTNYVGSVVISRGPSMGCAYENRIMLLQRFNYARDLRRGQVVALRNPYNANTMLVKRIVALEEDVVSIRPAPRVAPLPGSDVEIPSGHIWVEGDNGPHSLDSNYFGPVSVGMVVGKIRWRLSPIVRKSIEKPDPSSGWNPEDPDETKIRPNALVSVGKFKAVPTPEERAAMARQKLEEQHAFL